MSSPVIVSTTPVIVAPINHRRIKIFLQNTGKEDVYFTKQISSTVPNIPSSTNYDFILYSMPSKGITTIEVETTSEFNAVVISPSSDDKDDSVKSTTIAIMETIVPSNTGCR